MKEKEKAKKEAEEKAQLEKRRQMQIEKQLTDAEMEKIKLENEQQKLENKQLEEDITYQRETRIGRVKDKDRVRIIKSIKENQNTEQNRQDIHIHKD